MAAAPRRTQTREEVETQRASTCSRGPETSSTGPGDGPAETRRDRVQARVGAMVSWRTELGAGGPGIAGSRSRRGRREARRTGSPSNGPEPVEEEELRRGRMVGAAVGEEDEEQARRRTGSMERDIDPPGEPPGGDPQLTKIASVGIV